MFYKTQHIDIHTDKAEKAALVSIGIPTYNGNKGVLKAIHSVISQDYTNIELIISDNCSDDDTTSILVKSLLMDSRIKYYHQDENIGMSGNFDFVLQNATGKYFMWLADDDTLEPGVLNKYVSFLEEHPDYSIASGQIWHWNKNNLAFIERDFTLEQESPTTRSLKYYRKVTYCGMYHGLMRKDFISRMYHKDVLGNDWHMIAKMAYMGKIKNFDFPGYHKLTGGESMNMHEYATSIGYSPISSYFVHFTIAIEAFKEVWTSTLVYSNMPSKKQFLFSISAFFSLLYNYYGKTFPRVIGGKIKRMLHFAHLDHFSNKFFFVFWRK